MRKASARQARYRRRQAAGVAVVRVAVPLEVIEAFIGMRRLRIEESEERREIGAAIEALLCEFAADYRRHHFM